MQADQARTDPARLVNMTRLDAHLASQGIDDPRAVGSHKTRLGLAFKRVHDLGSTRHKAALEQSKQTRKTHSDFVCLGDALGNANNQADLILNRLDNGVSCARRRHVQHGCVGLGLANGLR